MNKIEIKRASAEETAGTISASDLFFSTKGLKVGDRYLVTSDEYPLGIVFYVNRKDCSTLYCPSLPRAVAIPQLKRNGGSRVFLTNYNKVRLEESK